METLELRAWIRQRNLEAVTFGQLLTLLDLVSAESVEKVGREQGREKNLSAGGVNARQKLERLNQALKLGPNLLRRSGRFSRPTEAGTRVAGEFRIFLHGLRAISSPKEEKQTWVIAAGDTWMQSLLMPALIRTAKKYPTWRWDARNLRSSEIRSGLRDGILHFGFMREGEVGAGLEMKPGYRHDSFTIVAGDAAGAPQTANGLIRWLIKKQRPFVQQASTWTPIREQLLKATPRLDVLSGLEIEIACQSHTQAAEAAHTQGTWCIVPSVIGRNYAESCVTMDIRIAVDRMVVAYNLRALSKHVAYDRARDLLCAEILRGGQALGR
ncbi:hypothetical protein K0B96_10805 [Horticoccus luteus]|uniref:LysR substrate-binding domain-containing protein n=1 Tax=Horticoccus luteus TaxID=2862869 RepID=A0A8F9TTF7_9BACT|nr:LysR substrate-binding domain-containing protein [Horticoccus luteus]QYM77810.1 hypothetical protein K0B96_10805 [Horticoccus luteus]